MAGDKFLRHDPATGNHTEVRGTQISVGAANAGDILALGDDGLLDPTVMPPGIGADTVSIAASESITAPALVNIFNVAGVAAVRNANATDATKRAHGFIVASVVMTGNATVYMEGRSSGWTGLTPGAPQFLAVTNGQRTETPPSAAGNVVQGVGMAVSATAMDFERGDVTVIAA